QNPRYLHGTLSRPEGPDYRGPGGRGRAFLPTRGTDDAFFSYNRSIIPQGIAAICRSAAVVNSGMCRSSAENVGLKQEKGRALSMSRLLLAPLALSGAAAIFLLAGCGGGGGDSSNPAPAVTQKVTGFVTDWDTAAPIAGATVKVQGTNITVTSAADGSYTVGPLNPTRSY